MPQYPPFSLVGSWLTTHEFLRELVRRGHEVSVTAYQGRHVPVTHDGIDVRSTFWPPGRLAPDLIVGHVGDDGSAAQMATEWDAPLVLMAHGGPLRAVRDVLERQRPACVVFNSRWFAEAVNWSGPQVMCRPPVDPAKYRTQPGEACTLVNLSVAKGSATFWALADRLPEVSFLAVRGQYGEQLVKSRENVTFRGPTPNMAADVYSRTRVLLMPSQHESFGRVAIEAACSGIPTVAHPCPGIREALGDFVTYIDREDIDGWTEAVHTLAIDNVSWLKASQAATARMRNWNHKASLDRFCSTIERVAGREQVVA